MLTITARWTAAVRARESERPDRLFNDPWAGILAGGEGLGWIEGRPAEGVIPIVLRTRFFDDFLQRVTAENAVRQIVLAASGLDTRAYRIEWPADTTIYELDRVEVLNYKDRILSEAGAAATCARRVVAVDLNGAWEHTLIEAGFDADRPSACLLEGLLFYLSNENLSRLLDKVLNTAAPGSFIGFDIVNRATLTSDFTRRWVKMQAELGAPWIGTMEDPAGFLSERGWEAKLYPIGSAEANYGRWPFPVIPANIPGMPAYRFVTGHKTGSSAVPIN
jgi:methyltransferase (TIGR00027 family)